MKISISRSKYYAKMNFDSSLLILLLEKNLKRPNFRFFGLSHVDITESKDGKYAHKFIFFF